MGHELGLGGFQPRPAETTCSTPEPGLEMSERRLGVFGALTYSWAFE